MNKGSIAVRLINLAKLITGRAPGALAQTNILANMLFGSISGSGTAVASAMDLSSDQSRKKRDMIRTSLQLLILQLHRQDF